MGLYAPLGTAHGRSGFGNVKPFPRAKQESLLLAERKHRDRLTDGLPQALTLQEVDRALTFYVRKGLNGIIVIIFTGTEAKPGTEAITYCRASMTIGDPALQGSLKKHRPLALRLGAIIPDKDQHGVLNNIKGIIGRSDRVHSHPERTPFNLFQELIELCRVIQFQLLGTCIMHSM